MIKQVPGIETHPERQGGEPCVAGTRVRIRSIGEAVEEDTYTPQEAADAKGVALSDVHRALAYHSDHPDETEQYADRQREREQQSRTAGAEAITDLRRKQTERDESDG